MFGGRRVRSRSQRRNRSANRSRSSRSRNQNRQQQRRNRSQRRSRSRSQNRQQQRRTRRNRRRQSRGGVDCVEDQYKENDSCVSCEIPVMRDAGTGTGATEEVCERGEVCKGWELNYTGKDNNVCKKKSGN